MYMMYGKMLIWRLISSTMAPQIVVEGMVHDRVRTHAGGLLPALAAAATPATTLLPTAAGSLSYTQHLAVAQYALH